MSSWSVGGVSSQPRRMAERRTTASNLSSLTMKTSVLRPSWLSALDPPQQQQQQQYHGVGEDTRKVYLNQPDLCTDSPPLVPLNSRATPPFPIDVLYDRVHSREVTVASILASAMVTFCIYDLARQKYDDFQGKDADKKDRGLDNPAFAFLYGIMSCIASVLLTCAFTYGNRIDLPLIAMAGVSAVSAIFGSLCLYSFEKQGDIQANDDDGTDTQKSIVQQDAFQYTTYGLVFFVGLSAALRLIAGLTSQGHLASHYARAVRRRVNIVKECLRPEDRGPLDLKANITSGRYDPLASDFTTDSGTTSTPVCGSSEECSSATQRTPPGFSLYPGWKVEVLETGDLHGTVLCFLPRSAKDSAFSADKARLLYYSFDARCFIRLHSAFLPHIIPHLLSKLLF